MTLQATIDLLRAILADLPAAITTGRDLVMLVNEAYERLAQTANEDEVTREDIERALATILASSRKIQSID
jgi:hypothetical protein